MSFSGIRDTLAAALQAALPELAVEVELPDSLVPPAVVVRWEGTGPGDTPALLEHSYLVEIWPTTDLTSETHYGSRDTYLRAAMACVMGLTLESAGVAQWSASGDASRSLGQQTYRIATLTVIVTEPALCA